MSKLPNENSQNSETQAPSESGEKLTPDQRIESSRLEQRNKIKKVVLVSSAVLAVALILFVVTQNFSATTTKMPSSRSSDVAQEFSAEQIETYRTEFKQALTRYEIEIQPDINTILLSQWETSRVNELNLIKEKALTAFAQGAFLQAKQHYDDLLSRSNALIAEHKDQTLEYVNAANVAFEQDNIPLAQINVNRALNLMPTNAQAIELQTRIDAYSEVSQLLSELRVAKIENNLPKQIDILSDIVDLDPSRNDLSDDLEKAQTDYDREQLENTLNRAQSLMNQGNLAQAQDMLDVAKSIKPDSTGLKRLQAKLNELASKNALAQILSQLKQYASNDNWTAVSTLASNSLETYLDDSELFDYQQKASQVQSATTRINQFIAKPQRLADEGIREAAKSAITKAFGPSLLSPTLAAKIQTLSEQIDKYELDVPVTINSDGETYIVVLGIGHVGQQVAKTILLKPGKYTLEGRREGFRSKRKEIMIEANQPLTVKLICDEPIVN